MIRFDLIRFNVDIDIDWRGFEFNFFAGLILFDYLG